MRSMAKQQYFTIGSLVEVQTDEEDYKGIYFLATIKERSKKKKKMYYVEYHNLLAREEQDSERLTEHVDISCLRPAPPPQELCNFEPNDVVDAFYKDGWWIGVVDRVVERGERTLVVTFQDPPDELEFGLDQLRIHWDWVDGRWTRPLNKSVAAMMYEGGREGEVSLDEEDCRDAWFLAILHEELGNGAFLAEYSKANADNKAQRLKVTADSFHVRPSPPQVKEKEFVLFEKVDAFFDFGWWSGIITKLLDGSWYVVFVKQMKRDKEFHQSDLRSYLEWKDEKWLISSQVAIHKSMAATSATIFSPTILTAAMVNSRLTIQRRNNVNFINGLNSYRGLKAQNSVVSSGLPICSERSFAKTVSTSKKPSNVGAMTSICNVQGCCGYERAYSYWSCCWICTASNCRVH